MTLPGVAAQRDIALNIAAIDSKFFIFMMCIFDSAKLRFFSRPTRVLNLFMKIIDNLKVAVGVLA